MQPIHLFTVFVAVGVFCSMEIITDLLRLIFCPTLHSDGPTLRSDQCMDCESAPCINDRIAMTIMASAVFTSIVVVIYVAYVVCRCERSSTPSETIPLVHSA